QGPELPSLTGISSRKDNGNGKLTVGMGSTAAKLKFGPPTQSGDGTVPTASGEAPGRAGVTASFRQGNEGSGERVRLNGKGKDRGYDHQDSYNDVRSQWATLFSVARISREADWA